MSKVESIKEQIEKVQVILEESLENLKKNPDDYSAKLLVLSTENHLMDLYKKMDAEKSSQAEK